MSLYANEWWKKNKKNIIGKWDKKEHESKGEDSEKHKWEK